jgi:hypothetical protein
MLLKQHIIHCIVFGISVFCSDLRLLPQPGTHTVSGPSHRKVSHPTSLPKPAYLVIQYPDVRGFTRAESVPQQDLTDGRVSYLRRAVTSAVSTEVFPRKELESVFQVAVTPFVFVLNIHTVDPVLTLTRPTGFRVMPPTTVSSLQSLSVYERPTL